MLCQKCKYLHATKNSETVMITDVTIFVAFVTHGITTIFYRYFSNTKNPVSFPRVRSYKYNYQNVT